MSKKSLSERIKLTSYEDMFGTKGDNTTSGHNVQKLESDDRTILVEQISDTKIVKIPLDELHSFKNHPFRVLNDEKMEGTIESVKKYGILVPGIVRTREEGGYEILSGHRRTHAAKAAGLTEIPMIIKECDDDEATVIMVDANIQREDLLISEKAKAYRMKYEALKHQGFSNRGKSSFEMIGESAGDNAKAVQRLIYVSRLIKPLMDLLDAGKLGFVQAIDISFLSEEAQSWVNDVISERGCAISGVQSAIIKEKYKAGELTASFIMEILCYENPVKKRKVTLGAKKLNTYFSASASTNDIENLIINLLEEWKQKGGEL